MPNKPIHIFFIIATILAVGFACDASAKLKPTKFQKTVADIPELDRQKITQIGYEPYIDKKGIYANNAGRGKKFIPTSITTKTIR